MNILSALENHQVEENGLYIRNDFFDQVFVKNLRVDETGHHDGRVIIYLEIFMAASEKPNILLGKNDREIFSNIACEISEDIDDIRETVYCLVRLGLIQLTNDGFAFTDKQRGVFYG